jgi:hypothetical protein
VLEERMFELINPVLRLVGATLEPGEEFRVPPLDVLRYYRRAVIWRGAIAPVPRISTKSGPFSPGEWLESLPGSTRGY